MAKIVSLSGGSPWGLAISGGKDFGSHVKVTKVSWFIPFERGKRFPTLDGRYVLIEKRHGKCVFVCRRERTNALSRNLVVIRAHSVAFRICDWEHSCFR